MDAGARLPLQEAILTRLHYIWALVFVLLAACQPPTSRGTSPAASSSTPAPARVRAVLAVPQGAWAVAVAPALRRAYVTSREADAVTLIDLDREAVAGTVRVGPDPHNVVVDAPSQRVFVTLHGGTSPARGDAVAVLDALRGAVLAIWPAGDFPAQLALDPTLHQLYVVNERANTLTILDLADGTLLAQLPMPGNPTDVAASPASGRVYVSDWIARQVVVIDGRAREIVGQFAVGSMPLRLAVDPARERAYVLDGTAPGAGRGEIWTLDLARETVERRPLGTLPLGVTVDATTGDIIVTDAQRGTLTVLDADSQTVRWEATVGAAPHGVVISRTLGRAYVVLGGSNSLAILDWQPEPLRAR